MTTELKLHLGCGKRHFAGWDSVDKADFQHIKSNNITELPYETNSADVIYASHVLEYFDREEVVSVLNEWRRVLKEDGTLYLSVPDFGTMSRLYQEARIPLHKFVGPLYGKMTAGGDMIYHKTVYDYSSLGELLRFVGFKSIEPWTRKELSDLMKDKSWDDHSQAKVNGELISLNISCKK